eukprot:1802691-Rhodomonas_salina.2
MDTRVAVPDEEARGAGAGSSGVRGAARAGSVVVGQDRALPARARPSRRGARQLPPGPRRTDAHRQGPDHALDPLLLCVVRCVLCGVRVGLGRARSWLWNDFERVPRACLIAVA